MKITRGTGRAAGRVLFHVYEAENPITFGLNDQMCFVLKAEDAKRLYRNLGKYLEAQDRRAERIARLQRLECITVGCKYVNIMLAKCMAKDVYRACPARRLGENIK